MNHWATVEFLIRSPLPSGSALVPSICDGGDTYIDTNSIGTFILIKVMPTKVLSIDGTTADPEGSGDLRREEF